VVVLLLSDSLVLFLSSGCLECPNIVEELVAQRADYISTSKLSIFAGTWNVNGGKNVYNVAFRHEQSLGSWLFPDLCKAILSFKMHNCSSESQSV
jgi:hypothetical protein